ncbi:MAG: flagellar export protein FliJ [Mobilitalea sp.]
MKKFQYHMENILQVKKKLEDQMKIAYGTARMRLNKEEEKLESMIQKETSYQDQLRVLRSDRLDIMQIKQCEQAVEFMKMNIKQQNIAVKNAAQRLEVARIRLHDAMVERKTQERLKEKAFDNYKIEYDAEERKEVDELNSFNYNNSKPDEEDR